MGKHNMVTHVRGKQSRSNSSRNSKNTESHQNHAEISSKLGQNDLAKLPRRKKHLYLLGVIFMLTTPMKFSIKWVKEGC